jgi:hypothetical protein
VQRATDSGGRRGEVWLGLVVDEEKVVWRVPIVLSLPELGDLGTVGSIDVDARSGRLLSEAADRQRIIEHAHRLFAGATLQTK